MKKIIMILDDDPLYSKKFCNQAIKLYGKKYLFLAFNNLKAVKEYSDENKTESLIVSESFIDNIEDIKVNTFYILNEKNRTVRKEGKKLFIYKLQNIKTILEMIDVDTCKKSESEKEIDTSCKLITFYSPITVKNKIEVLKKIAKYVSKKKKVLIVDVDEFSNYKGNVGLSNIIYDYKENELDSEKVKKEIINEKDQDYIKSTTYPEDFNVITSIDLANIVNEIRNAGYDYIFFNADNSYTKSQYIFNDSDMIILVKEKDNENMDIFKKYIKNENKNDMKKFTEFDMQKNDRAYMTAFVKQCFE